MRFILPAALTAAALLAGAVPATARTHRRHAPERVRSHITLHISSHDVAGGRRLVLRGRVRPRGAHRVKLVFRGARGATVGAASRRNGAFSVRWRPNGLGTYRVRAYGLHDKRVRASVSPARRVTAYRSAAASYYGPGLYGGALACGGTLQPGTLGVANKTLPCGSKVRLRYRGHSVTVPVVDRGPYVAGRDFDLTAATRARLHFPSTGVLLSSR
ncbi:MAG TPA: septal ring lytic transglycosylase RlpA family protein [Solirubrobacterales bacterium]|nr:septal ring lytic transglycosylase RlpA family protein [Solirubrobacterales bacterium]